MCVCAETMLDEASCEAFLDAAVDFVNSQLFGTLGITLTVTDAFRQRQANHLDRAIDRLRYGTVCINQWSGIADVSIRGQGMDQTIIDFTQQSQGSGSEGFLIKADRFTMEDLTIRRVRTWWSDGASEQNGAYGIYPVMCSDVLIEHCVAQFASDAGIYVGQTRRAVVRYNRAEQNVAGIEIENTVGADVYENEATNNTGGILVFSLPGLQLKIGSHTRVFKNRLHDNNHPNFAHQGAMVASVPPIPKRSGFMTIDSPMVDRILRACLAKSINGLVNCRCRIL